MEKMNIQMKPISIIPETKMTLRQVLEITKRKSVMSTYHVGNKWVEDIIWTVLGIRVNQIFTQSRLDTLDSPDKLRFNGQSYDLIDLNQGAVLSPWLKFSDTIDPVVSELRARFHATSPAHLHFLSSLEILGSNHPKNTLLNVREIYFGHGSEIIRDLITVYHDAVAGVEDFDHQIFTRFINGNGEVIKSQTTSPYSFGVHRYNESDFGKISRDYFDLQEALLHSVEEGDEILGKGGPMMKNEFSILLDVLIEIASSLRDGSIEVDENGAFHSYQMSGPSMIEYITKNQFITPTTKMYLKLKEVAKKSLGINLPESLIIHVIPGATLGYLELNSDNAEFIRPLIKDFVEIYGKITQILEEIRVVEDKGSKIEEKKKLLKNLREIQSLVASKVKSIRQGKAPYSQYDFIDGNRRLPNFENLLDIPFDEHAVIYEQI